MYPSKYNLIFRVPDENKEEIILFNPLSGALDIINEETLKILNNLKESGIENKQLIQKFIERGYIFKNKLDEEKGLSRMYELFEKFTSKKERYVICPTYSCNLNCTYCFQKQIISRTSDLMSEKVLKSAFDAINNLRRDKDSEITISLYGGEPFIPRKKQVEIIKKTIKKCKENNYGLTATTNGVCLTRFSDILENDVVEQVQVTIDGTKEIHDRRRVFIDGKGTFDLIIKGITSLLENGIKVVIRVNVDSENINNLPLFADFIVEKGWEKKIFCYLAPVKHFSCEKYTYCIPEYKILEKISEIYNQYEQTKILTLGGWQGIDTLMNLIKYGKLFPPQFKNCEANINTYALDLYGDIYTCLSVCGDKRFSIGKFHPKLKIDKNKLDMWRNRSIFNTPKCRECKFSLLCGGGCAIFALYEKGSLSAPCCKPIEEALKIGFSLYIKDLKAMVSR